MMVRDVFYYEEKYLTPIYNSALRNGILAHPMHAFSDVLYTA